MRRRRKTTPYKRRETVPYTAEDYVELGIAVFSVGHSFFFAER
jgi:hypothetical protein